MKRELTLIAGVLAFAVALGAAIGFIRRRMQRMDALPGHPGANGSASLEGAEARSPLAAVNGDRA